MKKDQRITFRLTVIELQDLKAKLDAAGFKTLGAYVRNNLCKSSPMAKVIVPLAAMQIALELQRVTNMIDQEKDSELVISELHNINNKLLGIQP